MKGWLYKAFWLVNKLFTNNAGLDAQQFDPEVQTFAPAVSVQFCLVRNDKRGRVEIVGLGEFVEASQSGPRQCFFGPGSYGLVSDLIS